MVKSMNVWKNFSLAGLLFARLALWSDIAVAETTKEVDGEKVAIPELGMSIKALPGWEVTRNARGMSLILEDPKLQKPVYDKVTYRKNLTVVTMHEPAPIDELEAGKIKEMLQESIAKGAGVTGSVVDSKHQFVHFGDNHDGIVVYSSFNFGETQLSQINLVVSGSRNRFLITYTDLTSEMQKQEIFDAAWSMISSVEVEGPAPIRFENLIPFGVALGLMVAGLGIFFGVRRFKARYTDADGSSDASIAINEDGIPTIDLNDDIWSKIFKRQVTFRSAAEDDRDDEDEPLPVSATPLSSAHPF